MLAGSSIILSPVLALASGGQDFNIFEIAYGATFWTWVVFLVAMIPAWNLVFGPIVKALDTRDQEVETAKKTAEETRQQAEAQIAEAKAELEKARAEGRRMVEEATARAEKQGQEALAKAKAEAERELQRAREEIDASKQRALTEIRAEVVNLAIAGAGKILQKDVDDDAHRKFVGDFVGNVGGGNG